MKTKIQNYCFFIHYNAIIYENGIRCVLAVGFFYVCVCAHARACLLLGKVKNILLNSFKCSGYLLWIKLID